MVKGAVCFIFILIFEACLFNIISSQCEFTQQGSPLQPWASLAVPRWDRSDSSGDSLQDGPFLLHSLSKYLEVF